MYVAMRIISLFLFTCLLSLSVQAQVSFGEASRFNDGWLFLLWDFRNASMPLIHVRTWQPSATVAGSDGVIDISDFNLE